MCGCIASQFFEIVAKPSRHVVVNNPSQMVRGRVVVGFNGRRPRLVILSEGAGNPPVHPEVESEGLRMMLSFSMECRIRLCNGS